MLPQVLSGIVMAVFEVALLACAVAALAAVIIWGTRLQVRTYRNSLARHFKARRRIQYHDLGLRPRARLLKELVDFDAVELLSNGTATSRSELPRWTLDLSKRIEASFRNPEVLTDTTGVERDELQADLLRVVPVIEWRYEIIRTLLCCTFGVVLCVLVNYSFVPTFSSGELTLFGGGDILAAHGSPMTVALSGILCGVLASIAIASRAEPRLGRDQAPTSLPMPTTNAAKLEGFKIGKPGEAMRAINFSAGAFDTVMHLGVIHALTVLQGKAPHAVVGLSVGALNAVALAEVLQAGEEAEKALLNGRLFHARSVPPELRAEIQRVRLVARAKRLREFFDAANRAPEELVRALLPDAYQIDESQPLAPLRQPRFDPGERKLRTEFVVSRAGLARLYNQILDLPFSVGTITKMIRRVLGIRAAFELSHGKAGAALVITNEIARLWVLIGQNLVPVASLVRFLRRTFMTRGASLRPANAALLIFRSRAWRETKRIAEYAWGFVLLFFVWYSVSLLALPFWLVVAIGISLLALWKHEVQELRIAAQDVRQGAWTWLTLMMGMTFLLWLITFMCNPSFFAARLAEHDGRIDALIFYYLMPLGLVLLTLLAATIVVVIGIRTNPQRVGVRFLARYGLNQSIFRPHGLRSYLIQLFDRSYYAKPTVDAAVDAALRRKEEGHVSMRPAEQKTVSHYASAQRLPGEQILVGLAVASTEKSGLTVAPTDAPLIDALSAATALTPFLPPVELPTDIDGSRRHILYIDGSRVSHEPTHALLALIRNYRNQAGHGPLHIYSVTPYPSSKQEMLEINADGTPKNSKYLDLIDIARRALRLQRFRDASLERRLTELVSSAIPGEECAAQGPHDVVLRAWITPVELEDDNAMNLRILGADPTERRQLVEKAIADGCRAAMQVMIPDVFKEDETLKCSDAVSRHFKRDGIVSELKGLRLSGEEKSPGPGLCEICNSCSFRRPAGETRLEQTLSRGPWSEHGPTWPHEREQVPEIVSPLARFSRPAPAEREERKKAWEEYQARIPDEIRWPRDSAPGVRDGNKRPTISLIFSGGVFRGVFQLGVLNGLNEIGLKPDLVAGASVGSITAAMVARAFSHDVEEEKCRPARIARLAAAFLAIDRLLLTDRFADFVRNLTVRAADTRFSIRDADQVFRKYDYPAFPSFERNVRNVVAGIERLLYVSPYDLNEMVRAIRTGNNEMLFRKVNERLQNFLNRMQIGEEALGAEALEELINRHVTDDESGHMGAAFTTDTLRERHGIQFLATTTNLQRGRLEVLGNMPGTASIPAPLLVQALLASSAFPGIFRPRWAWELAACLDPTHRFVDGGIMDNLPLDAIANFLDRAGETEVAGQPNMINKEPASPHLMIGASLEVNAPPYALTFTRERLKASWPLLRMRARQLSYNTKLDTYEHAEQAIRHVHSRGTGRTGFSLEKRTLLSLQLVSIRPNWLCGTFAVHPMLGFRRKKQMMSIAHGCASTIRRLSELYAENGEKFKSWRLSYENLPPPRTWSQAFKAWKDRGRPKDECWLREGCICPFSRKALEAVKPALEPTLIDEVSKIHKLCPQLETQLRKL